MKMKKDVVRVKEEKYVFQILIQYKIITLLTTPAIIIMQNICNNCLTEFLNFQTQPQAQVLIPAVNSRSIQDPQFTPALDR